ncbi:MAG TPA: GNAT family N-acetyltransferase [Candidatus Dormibacteraeota bacterium]|nr:GNAT family N-acetyltransferase [Candidatus Dormibacteraeota bacterium]
MSSIEIVDVDRADMAAFVATAQGFWGEPGDDGLDLVKDVLSRALLARIDGGDVGAAAVIDFQLTLPGGAAVPMDGVTWVAVSATARRRGALRAMMGHCLESARARRIPVLGLGASESSIYRRFGYGVASHIGDVDIDTAQATLRVPFEDPGRLRFEPFDTGIPALREIESQQPDRVGGIRRSENHWRRLAASVARPRDGMGPMQVVLHEDGSGQVDGFSLYRLEMRWPDELADGIVHVHALTGLNCAAHVALWQHVLGLDLIEHLQMERFWPDDPIQHLLADPRRLRIRVRDDLHLRVVDVVAMLQSRRYSREDSVVIEVRDQACPDVAGRYRVEGGLEGAAAAKTDAAADIVLDNASLGSVMLGDSSVAALHRAGLVEETRPGAVRRASAMFSWSPRPWLNHMF